VEKLAKERWRERKIKQLCERGLLIWQKKSCYFPGLQQRAHGSEPLHCYSWRSISFFTITAEIHARSLVNFMVIKSILKSLVIFAIWLALSGVTYSRIALFFCSKSHLFLSQWEWESKTKQSIRFQGSIKVIHTISRKWKAQNHFVAKFATTVAKTLLLLFLSKNWAISKWI